MAIFGLGDDAKSAKKSDNKAKKDDSSAKSSSTQSDEAKALLEKMEAKKDAGECPFC